MRSVSRRAAGRLVFLTLPFLFPGCCAAPSSLDPEAAERRARVVVALEEVRRDLRPLSFDGPWDTTAAERAYLDHYGLALASSERGDHHFGSIETPDGGPLLAAHVWRAPEPRGTVFFLHGYYDHVGVVAGGIAPLIAAGYTVVAFDLPGHGLSEGERVAIDDFAEYRGAFQAVIDRCASEVPRPWHLVGHSTGGAVALDRLLLDDPSPFERVVLIAPLVRSAYWSMSRFGSSVVGWFTDEVSRLPRKDSSDEAFLRFRRYEDPLRYESFPLDWYDALVAWVAEIEDAEPVAAKVLVIQGEKDDTVAWRGNLRLIGGKLPGVRVVRIPGGNHQLLNEAEPYRSRTIHAMLDFLREPSD